MDTKKRWIENWRCWSEELCEMFSCYMFATRGMCVGEWKFQFFGGGAGSERGECAPAGRKMKFFRRGAGSDWLEHAPAP